VTADDMVGIMYLFTGLGPIIALFLGAFLIVWAMFLIRSAVASRR
jgi:uncharacterized membrane protein YqiK